MFFGRRSSYLICITLGMLAHSYGEMKSPGAYNITADNLVTPKLSDAELLIRMAVQSSKNGTLKQIFTSKEWQDLKHDIEAARNATLASSGENFVQNSNHTKKIFQAIYPGTKWCGDGDIAANDTDFGVLAGLDACCRAHDKCPESIVAGQSYKGLLNDGVFTKSACSCDQEFYTCLKNENSREALLIGSTYFDILRPRCIALEYPILSCETEKKWFGLIRTGKCTAYHYNTTAEKKLQWFNNQKF